MRRNYFLIALSTGLIVLLLWLTRSYQFCPWDFHNSLWGPVNLLVNGQTPYTLTPPYGPYPGVWMPQTIGAFIWFGAASCSVSAKIWLLAEICGFIWIIWLINENQLPSPWLLAVCLLALFLYPPLWVHVHLGQFSMMFVILMMLNASVPGAQRWSPLLLALGLAKPQLGILVYPGLVVHTWREKGFKAAARLVLLTVLAVALLTIPLFVFYPGWAADFLFITFDNLEKGWDLPTLFVQLPVLFGQAGFAIWGLVFIVSFGASTWLWYTHDRKTAVIFSLALTPMVTAYASSWDFMLLLPAFYWVLMRTKSREAQVVLTVGTAGIYGLQVAARLESAIPDASQWWVPPALLIVFLISLLVEIKKTKAGIMQFVYPVSRTGY